MPRAKIAGTPKAIRTLKHDGPTDKPTDGDLHKRVRKFSRKTIERRNYRKQVRQLQKSDGCVFRYAPMDRLVREIAQDFSSDIRFKKGVTATLSMIAQEFGTELMLKADEMAGHAKRITIMPEDLFVALKNLGPVGEMMARDDKVHKILRTDIRARAGYPVAAPPTTTTA